MAGTLPGVECARRRRFHQSGGGTDVPSAAALGMTRRSTFCLYTSNTYHDSHPSSSSSSSQPRSNNQANQDQKLGGLAGEAKERLDERLSLRAERKSETKRNIKIQESLRSATERRTMESRDLQIEVFGVKESGSKKFNWAKLGWQPIGQVECAICLEVFKKGEPLVKLPCAHRFHSRCLVPWLETNAHCPCCRMGILN